MSDRDQAILDAALALYAEGGLNAVTIRALGERAGASTGSIYHRFGGRGGVLAALLLRCFEAGFGQLAEVLAPGPEAEAGVRGLVRAWMRWVERSPVQARFLYEATLSPDVAPYTQDLQRFKERFFLAVAAWMQPRIYAGLLRSMPDWAWDPVLFGPVHELCRRWLAGAPLPLDQAAAELEETVWRAVRG